MLAKFTFFLALAPLVGIFAKYLVGDQNFYGHFVANTDVMIITLVGALFIQITTDFLATYLHMYRARKISAYTRVILGIILAVIILNS